MAGAREVLAAIARAMQGLGGAGPADAGIAQQLGTPTQYPSEFDARRAFAAQEVSGTGMQFPTPDKYARAPGHAGAGLTQYDTWENTGGGTRPRRMASGRPYTGGFRTAGANPFGAEGGPVRFQPPGPGPDVRGTFGRGTQVQPWQAGPATPRAPVPPGLGPRTAGASLTAPTTPRGPVGPDIRGTFGERTAPTRAGPFRPNMRMGFPPPSTPPAIRGLGPRTAGASLTAPTTRGAAGAARAMAGQAAGGEVRAATAAMNRPLTPRAAGPAGPPGWQGVTRPYNYPEGFEPPGTGRTPPGPRGSERYGGRGGPGGSLGGGYDPRPGQRLPAVPRPGVDISAGFGKTSYGGISGWARGAHNPFEIARNYGTQVKATVAAGGPGKLAGGATYGRIGASIAKTGWGPGTMAFFRAANPAIMTAMVGNLMLGAAGFEEGTKGDIIGEGLMVGAAFGAPWGGVGALIGAPAFMALNVVTGGAAANLVQALPLVGGLFGGTETKQEDARDIAQTMFSNAATAQGLDSETAELMSSTFEAYWKMAEAGMIDPSQLVQMIYQTGRQHGLTGFPWEPEAMNPAYSAEDIAGITESVGKALMPLQDVATSMMNMDYSHIQDEAIRARLIESSNRVAENIVNGMGAAVQGPATTAMLGEAQANAQLGDQLGGFDPFEANLLGAMG